MQLVKLWPRAPVRTWPTNQTFFGAICWAVRWLYGADCLASLLDELAENPLRLVISDALLFARVGNAEYFFVPKPVEWNTRLSPSMSTEDMKRLKAARWATPEALAVAELRALSIPETGIICRADQEDTLAKVRLPKRIDEAHATINRLTGSTTEPGRLFFLDAWVLPPASGFYVLVHADGSWREVWQPALRFAAEGGIGGKRTSGRGSYDIEFVAEPPAQLSSKTGSSYLLLGRAVVHGDAFECLGDSFYEMTIEHGRIDSAATGREAFRPPRVLLERGSVVAGDECTGVVRLADGFAAWGTALREHTAPEGAKGTVTYGIAPCLPFRNGVGSE